ncbi:hypothetical protein ACE2AJ_04520 [Aquihabitans daechungensis]|uniref:hypothetical protein n=1 Tax=Aquihabitans daechungensis TaxID=1052257 RepID=UPI003BA26D99
MISTRAPGSMPRPAGRSLRVVLVAGALVALVGCGGGGGDDAAATTTAPKAPEGCDAAPFPIQLGVGEGTAGSSFEVADAAAQRVAILPGKMAFDAGEMAGLTSQAAVSPLGQYTVYVSDDTIDTAQLEGNGEGSVADGSATVAAIRVVPAAEGGFVAGEVVAPTGELGYVTRSDQVPVRAAVVPKGSKEPLTVTDDLTGTVTVLEVGDESICLDVDLTIAGAQGGQIDGVVLAPVFRAGDSYFMT